MSPSPEQETPNQVIITLLHRFLPSCECDTVALDDNGDRTWSIYHPFCLLPASKSNSLVCNATHPTTKNHWRFREPLLYTRYYCDAIAYSCVPILSISHFDIIQTHKRTKGWLCNPSHNFTITYKPFVPILISWSKDFNTLVSKIFYPTYSSLIIFLELHQDTSETQETQPRRRHSTFRCTLSTPNFRFDGANTAGCLSLLPMVVSYIHTSNPMLFSDKGELTNQGSCIHIHTKLLLFERCCSLHSSTPVEPWSFRSCTLIHTTQYLASIPAGRKRSDNEISNFLSIFFLFIEHNTTRRTPLHIKQ